MRHFHEIDGGLLVAEEFVAAAGASGISLRLDMLLYSRLPASAAATITTTASGRADACHRTHVADGSARTVIANSGNANAATGAQGMRAEGMAELAALETTCRSPGPVCSTSASSPDDRVEVVSATAAGGSAATGP